MIEIKMSLYSVRYEYSWQGKVHRYTATIVAESPEGAEQLIHKLHSPDYIQTNKLYDIHGISDTLSKTIAQANYELVKAEEDISKGNDDEQSRLYYMAQYQNLPDIQSVISRYKGRT